MTKAARVLEKFGAASGRCRTGMARKSHWMWTGRERGDPSCHADPGRWWCSAKFLMEQPVQRGSRIQQFCRSCVDSSLDKGKRRSKKMSLGTLRGGE